MKARCKRNENSEQIQRVVGKLTKGSGEETKNGFEKTLAKICLNYVKTIRLQISEVESLQSTRNRNATGPRYVVITMFQASDESEILDQPGKGWGWGWGSWDSASCASGMLWAGSPRRHRKKQDIVACICNPSTVGVGTEWAQGLTGQPTWRMANSGFTERPCIKKEGGEQ